MTGVPTPHKDATESSREVKARLLQLQSAGPRPLSKEFKLYFIPAFVAVLFLDQITKYWVRHSFLIEEVSPVIDGFFNLTLRYNYGAAFSLFAELPSGIRELVLAVGKLLALGVLLYLFRRPEYGRPQARLALGLIFGGAIGNITDRLLHGAVVDFLDFYIGITHWPAFNVADSAICVGVALLVFYRPAEEGDNLNSGSGSGKPGGRKPEGPQAPQSVKTW